MYILYLSTLILTYHFPIPQDEEMEPTTLEDEAAETVPATSSAPAPWRKPGEFLEISLKK